MAAIPNICPANGNNGSIMNMVLRMIQLPYEAILGISTEEYSVGDKIVSSIESLLGGDLANLEIGYSIIGVIFLIMVAVNLFKIILSAVERYVTLGILVYTCPLAFAMGATQTTLPIFTSWCRGLGGQGVVLLLSVWCLKVIFSAFQANVENGGQLIWLLLILAFMKACQKLEGHIAKLGLSVSSTGGSILNEAGSTYMGIMVAARSASKGYHKIQKRFNPGEVGAKSPGMSSSQNKKSSGVSSDKAGGGQQSGGSSGWVGGTSGVNTNGKGSSANGRNPNQTNGTSETRAGTKGQGNTGNKDTATGASSSKKNRPQNGSSSEQRETGNVSQNTGGKKAENLEARFQKYTSQNGKSNIPPKYGDRFTNISNADGVIKGTAHRKTEDGREESQRFQMQDSQKCKKPEGDFDTVTSSDGKQWYFQLLSNPKASKRSGNQTGENGGSKGAEDSGQPKSGTQQANPIPQNSGPSKTSSKTAQQTQQMQTGSGVMQKGQGNSEEREESVKNAVLHNRSVVHNSGKGSAANRENTQMPQSGTEKKTTVSTSNHGGTVRSKPPSQPISEIQTGGAASTVSRVADPKATPGKGTIPVNSSIQNQAGKADQKPPISNTSGTQTRGIGSTSPRQPTSDFIQNKTTVVSTPPKQGQRDSSGTGTPKTDKKPQPNVEQSSAGTKQTTHPPHHQETGKKTRPHPTADPPKDWNRKQPEDEG